MTERCPTCGTPVTVISGDEGTSYYEPASAVIMRDLEREIVTLRRNVESLLRELDKERNIMPSEGVFLVEHHGASKGYMRIAKLGELPDPLAFAAIARHQQAIAQAIVETWQNHNESWGASARDLAEGIVRALAREEGQR